MSKILLVDLHNTVVDEFAEYGAAIDAAIDSFFTSARNLGRTPPADLEDWKQRVVYPQIRAGHIALGDDWDNRVFGKEYAPALFALIGHDAQFEIARQNAVSARLEFSRSYVMRHAYTGIRELLIRAQEQNYDVFIITDGTENAVHPAVKWLGLDGKITGVYCCASPRESGLPWDYYLTKTPVKVFAEGRVKPDARIVAQILLDVARRRGMINPGVQFDDAFELQPSDDPVFAGKPDYVSSKLLIKPGVYQLRMQKLLQDTIGIGDDNRDLVLHRNAGIASVKVGYEADIPGIEPAQIGLLRERGKAILKAVTGWDDERLSLFSGLKSDAGNAWLQAGNLPSFTAATSADLAVILGIEDAVNFEAAPGACEPVTAPR